VLKNELASLGSAAKFHDRRISTGQRKHVRIQQGTTLEVVLAGAPANQRAIGIPAEIRRAPR
jgi:hypothetical protein